MKKENKIQPLSKKRQKLQVKYRKLVNELLNQDEACSIQSPVCIYFAGGLNHKQKRSAKNLIELKNLERSCNPCNTWVEEHPEEAKKKGHFISKFSPELK